MSESNDAKLRQLDLPLLAVFSAIMRHRKLTLVASQLGLTASAVSHSLKRLRAAFDDELFMRRPFGVAPTQKAIDIAPKIEEILDLSRHVLGQPASFDPTKSERLFRIAAPDHEVGLFAPELIASLRSRAPGVKFSFRHQARQAAVDALSANDIDLALGMLMRTPSTAFDSVQLFRETYLVLARHKHPAIRRKLDVKTYVALDHVLVSLSGGLKGVVDHALVKHGLARNVVASVPSFFAAMSVVSGSDAIATIPARMAARYARRFGLTTYEPPVAIRPFTVSALSHRRNRSDPGLQWLVQTLQRMVR